MISRMRVWRSVVSVIGGLLGLLVVTDFTVAVGGLVSHFHYAFLVRYTLDGSESGGALSAVYAPPAKPRRGTFMITARWGLLLGSRKEMRCCSSFGGRRGQLPSTSASGSVRRKYSWNEAHCAARHVTCASCKVSGEAPANRGCANASTATYSDMRQSYNAP